MRCRTSSSSTLRRSTSSVARRSRDSSAETRVGLVELAHARLDELVHVRAVQLQLHLHPQRLPPQDQAHGDDHRREATCER